MAQTATSYYHGIFTPPSSPNGVIKQGVIADVTGATAPTTAASVTYTPPSGAGIDTLIINGLPLDITYNTSATQTVTDAKTALANGGTAVNTTTVGSLALTGYASTPFDQGGLAMIPVALAYGLIGYGLAFARERRQIPAWMAVWARPLQRFSMAYSFGDAKANRTGDETRVGPMGEHVSWRGIAGEYPTRRLPEGGSEAAHWKDAWRSGPDAQEIARGDGGWPAAFPHPLPIPGQHPCDDQPGQL